MKHAIRRLLPFLCWMFFALSLLGCGAPATYYRSSSSLLPSSAQVEADAARLAIPRELRAKLTAIAAKSCNGTKRPDPRIVAQTYRDPFGETNERMLFAILKWGLEQAYAKSPEERAALLQTRQMLPLPPLQWQPSEPVPAAEAPPLTLQDSRVQFGGALIAGAALGAVPLGPAVAEIGIELRVLPKGTYWARVGKACGEIIVGTGQIILGCTGMTAGAGISGTGGGAVVGVPVMAGSILIAANGCATTGHGLGELYQVLREGDAPAASVEPAPASGQWVLKKEPQKAIKEAPVTEAAPAVKPSPPPPPETTTTTRIKGPSGETVATVTKKSGGTTTTTRVKAAPTQTTAPVNNAANSSTTTVYRSVNQATNEVQYVGMTNDFARRNLEHMRARGFDIEEVVVGLSRTDARAVEQALIELHGLGKTGGTLLNKINSIAKTNPDLAQLLQRGYDLLKAANYKM